jgi:putative ATP-binding cassette transporter
LDAKHSHRKFSEMMSPGQRQLFAIARIFVHQPTLVFLDEATSSMPAVDEERVYKAMAEEGIAYVSVGHRDSLIAHHDQIVDCGAMFR